MTTQPRKRIPYALADFRLLREANAYYVDKTRFIPLIEAAPYYLFCIRPRRFGKTLWLTLLDYYYDVNEKENFDALFGDTYIGQHPTADRNAYLILNFDFAFVNPNSATVEQLFQEHLHSAVEKFVQRYHEHFSVTEQRALATMQRAEQKLLKLFAYGAEKRVRLYGMVDNYDHFAHTIVQQEGKQAYRKLTSDASFFCYFFNLLKGATTGRVGSLARLFITGVSPTVINDLISAGFNISTNITLDKRFHQMFGFTEEEVRAMLTYYRDGGTFPLDVEAILVLLREQHHQDRPNATTNTPTFDADMVMSQFP